MSNTTDTYWSVDGESLQTYAFNITTWGGDRQTPPVFRGSDITIPYAVGDKWMPKLPSNRIMTFSMWVIGATEDGRVPDQADSRQLFEENWYKLRSLLWTPGRQFRLTKKFTIPGLPGIYEATALGEFAGGLSPVMTGETRATFSVDVKLADPFFYGDPVSISFPNGSRTKTFDVLGDYETTAIVVTTSGVVSTPNLVNQYYPNVFLHVNRAFGSAEVGTIDVAHFNATHLTAGPVTTKIPGAISSGDGNYWFTLGVGSNTVVVTLVSGTGTVTLTYQPRWL